MESSEALRVLESARKGGDAQARGIRTQPSRIAEVLFGFLQEFFFYFEVFNDRFHDEVGAVDAAELIRPIHS